MIKYAFEIDSKDVEMFEFILNEAISRYRSNQFLDASSLQAFERVTKTALAGKPGMEISRKSLRDASLRVSKPVRSGHGWRVIGPRYPQHPSNRVTTEAQCLTYRRAQHARACWVAEVYLGSIGKWSHDQSAELAYYAEANDCASAVSLLKSIK